MTLYPSPSSGIVSLNVAAPPRLRVHRPVQEGLPRHTHELGIEHALIRPTMAIVPVVASQRAFDDDLQFDPPKVDLIEVVAAYLPRPRAFAPDVALAVIFGTQS